MPGSEQLLLPGPVPVLAVGISLAVLLRGAGTASPRCHWSEERVEDWDGEVQVGQGVTRANQAGGLVPDLGIVPFCPTLRSGGFPAQNERCQQGGELPLPFLSRPSSGSPTLLAEGGLPSDLILSPSS